MAKKRPANQGKTARPQKTNGGPRTRNRLTATFVRTVSEKGTYGDGGNLFLQVGIGGKAKSWLFLFDKGRLTPGHDSHGRFIKALEQEHRDIPPTTRRSADRIEKLLKIARAILKDHEWDYVTHEAAYKSGERKINPASARRVNWSRPPSALSTTDAKSMSD
jgi:hypothetical protein